MGKMNLLPEDLEFCAYSPNAAGMGTHKITEGITVIHPLSGTVVKCKRFRYQHENKAAAIKAIQTILDMG